MKPNMLIGLTLAVLGLATAFLMWLNWNGEIRNKLYGSLITGTAVLLALVLTSLKESTIEKSFLVSIVFDEKEKLPAHAPPQGPRGRWWQQQRIATLTRPMGFGGEKPPAISKPEGYEQTMKFLGEIFQYKLMCDLASVQQQGKGVLVSVGGGSVTTEAWVAHQHVMNHGYEFIN